MPGSNRDESVSAAMVQGAVRAHIDRSVTTEQAEQLACYLNCLLRWNKRINLVSGSDWETVLTKLILDSFFLAELLDSLAPVSEPRVLDVGAGAGIPGIPYRILRHSGSYVMLEPRGKRHTFLSYVLSLLQLSRTEAVRSRLQDLPAEEYRADILVGRGTTQWRRFLQLIEPYGESWAKAVVFSGSSFPRKEIPPGPWELIGESSYRTSPDLAPRYLWSFCPKKAPS